MIQLGQKAKDKITGFTGIITARTQYITGCDHYCLTPEVGRNGEQKDVAWFDEGRIQITGKGIAVASVAGKSNGGPQPTPPNR